MAKHGTWHRRGLAIVAASSMLGSITIWVTQVALGTPATAATVQQSPYFAGAVTNPPLMHTKAIGGGKFYTESARVSFVVPTITCLASQDTGYEIFQSLEGAPGESGVAALSLSCASGTLIAEMFTNANTGNGTSEGCNNVPVAPGDSISFSEQDQVFVFDGLIPTGLIDLRGSDSTNGQSTECSSPTTNPPAGPVSTGMCDWASTTGPIPPNAPPPPPNLGCGSAKVSAFNPLSLSNVKVDNKAFWRWRPRQQYDMYKYRRLGIGLAPIEQVHTQRVGNALDFTFMHR